MQSSQSAHDAANAPSNANIVMSIRIQLSNFALLDLDPKIGQLPAIIAAPVRRALVAAFFLFLPCQYILIYMNRDGLFTIFIPVYVFLVMPILAARSSDTTGFLQRCVGI